LRVQHSAGDLAAVASVTDIHEIRRLRLEPGDVLIARVKGTVSADTLRRVHDYVSLHTGCAKVLAIDECIDLSVLSAADASKLADSE
jgi:hypothetical protein